MEKKYVSPEVKVVEMEATTLMAASEEPKKQYSAESGSWKGLDENEE